MKTADLKMVKNISCCGRNIINRDIIYGLINPLVGIFILTFMLAVNLLIIGIESIVHGVSGKKNLASSESTTSVL